MQAEQDRKEKEQLEREEQRQKIIRTGDIASAKEHTDWFSTDEVNQIINKYAADQRLSQLYADANPEPKTPAEKTRAEKVQERVAQLQKVAGTVASVADSAKKIYDAYETVNNILGSGERKRNEAASKQKAEDEAAKKAKEEAWKKNIIMTRDMASMLANKNQFTSGEIKELLGNVEADEKLREKVEGGSSENKSNDNVDKSENTNKQNNQNQQQKSTSNQSQSEQKQTSNQPKSTQSEQKQTNNQPQQTKAQDSGPSLMDKVMARAKNASEERRSASERRNHDKAYYSYQSSQVLELMKDELERSHGPVSQINMIEDILQDRRKKGVYD